MSICFDPVDGPPVNCMNGKPFTLVDGPFDGSSGRCCINGSDEDGQMQHKDGIYRDDIVLQDNNAIYVGDQQPVLHEYLLDDIDGTYLYSRKLEESEC